jgi:hypothetical protein
MDSSGSGQGPVDQWIKMELSDNFWYKSSVSIFNKICETVYGIHGKVHLWIYVNIVAEYQNCPTTFGGSVGSPMLWGRSIWVGPTAGLDAVTKRNIPDPIRNLNLVVLPYSHYYVAL